MILRRKPLQDEGKKRRAPASNTSHYFQEFELQRRMAAYKRMNYSETLIKGISLRPSFRLYRASAPLRQKSAYIMANWI